jgi:hypothetical protein
MHTKEWLHLRVTSHTSRIQNKQKGLSESDYDSSDVLSRSTPHSVQQSHPPHHQYLHPKKLHLYGCCGSHIHIGKSVSSPLQ